ncbi:MAG: fibrinogen-like YCDxxxxGGGW domain-containing protein, partial [Bradymonadaceae bacterium]
MRITSPSFVLLVVLASACISDPSTMSYTPGSLSEPDAASDISPADTSWPDAVTMDSEGDTFDARREDMPEEDAAPRPDIITEHFFSSCATLLAAHPETVDGRYTIAPMEGVEVEVYCDMQTDGGVGYTMKRIDDAEHLLAHQGAYREACAALGMEVIVPRTRAHALSIYSFNQDRTPNLVNVFPRHDGAVGLGEWEGRCQGQPCSFYLSETDNSNCTRTFEPNGNN